MCSCPVYQRDACQPLGLVQSGAKRGVAFKGGVGRPRGHHKRVLVLLAGLAAGQPGPPRRGMVASAVVVASRAGTAAPAATTSEWPSMAGRVACYTAATRYLRPCPFASVHPIPKSCVDRDNRWRAMVADTDIQRV